MLRFKIFIMEISEVNTQAELVLEVLNSPEFSCYESHNYPRIDCGRFTAICFMWQHDDGFLKVLEILAQSAFSNNQRLVAVRGEWKLENDVDVFYLGVTLPQTAIESFDLNNWRGVTTELRLSLWPFYNEQEGGTTQLLVYVTRTVKRDTLLNFAQLLQNGSLSQFAASEISAKIDELQFRELRTIVPNESLLEALCTDSLDRLIDSRKLSMHSFLTEQLFTEKVRQCLIDKLLAARKLRLSSFQFVPNLWGIWMLFQDSPLQTKQRHFYIHGPSNYGKSLFRSLLLHYYNAAVINPSARTHKGVSHDTQIILVDEFKKKNAYSIAQLNELADGNFKFKVLYRDDFVISRYIVIILANDPLEAVLGNLGESEKEQLANRYFQVDLRQVEQFHNVDFRDGEHYKISAEAKAKIDGSNSDIITASAPSLLKAYTKLRKIAADLDASDSLDVEFGSLHLDEVPTWKVPSERWFRPLKVVPKEKPRLPSGQIQLNTFLKPREKSEDIIPMKARVNYNNIQTNDVFSVDVSEIEVSSQSDLSAEANHLATMLRVEKPEQIKMLGSKRDRIRSENVRKTVADSQAQIRVPRQHKATVKRLVDTLKNGDIVLPEEMLKPDALKKVISLYEREEVAQREKEKLKQQMDSDEFK